MSWSGHVVGTVPLSKGILVHFALEENTGKLTIHDTQQTQTTF